MRSEDEDEEDYDEDENIDEDEDGDQYGGHQMPPSEGVYDEEDQDGDADGDGDDDDAEGEGEEDDDDQQNDEDDDEDEQDQDGDDDDDEDGEGDDDDDEEGEDGDGEGEGHDDEEDADVELGATQDVQEVDGQDGDVDMEDKVGGRDTARKRSRSTTPINALSPSRRPPPPHLVRRAQLIPTYTSPPKSLSIDAIVAIPTPVPVHCLASTACSSYLLTGGQDGYVRAYDFYASVNGQQQLTAQQRVIIGMGETVSKMGVARGWWANEVGSDDEDDGEGDDGEADADGEGEMEVDGPVGGVPSSSSGAQKGKQGPDGKAKKKEKEPGDTKLESVYSMAVEGDGLWALTGSQSGPINMYTLRHDPGRLVHTLRGHRSVVSSMAVLPDEKGLMSGSWDGSIKQWDLNTGGIVRHYPTHGAQISSLSLQPTALFPYSSPSPRHRGTMQSEMGEDKEDNEQADAAMADTVSVLVGPDFFKADRTSPLKGQNDAQQAASSAEANADSSDGKGHATRKDGDVDMDASPSKEAEKPTPKTSSPTKAASPIPSPKAAGSKRESREASFDDLFADDIADADGEADAEGEADADGEADAEGETVPPSEIGTGTNTPHASNGFGGLALPGLALPQPMASTSSASGSGAKSNIIGLNTSTAAAAAAAAPVRGAADALPLLSPATYRDFSEGVMLASFMDGQVMLIDRRVPEKEHAEGRGVGRFTPGEKAPPWCMSACWSGDGTQILAGRRNGTIDIWDVRKSSSSTAPNLLRTLRTPPESGPVSCVVPFPDGRHIATASQDNVRLWNTAEYFEESAEESIRRAKSKPPFKIIAGHHGGIVSSMIVDPTSRFLTVASGDRGWQGESTKVVLIHEIRW